LKKISATIAPVLPVAAETAHGALAPRLRELYATFPPAQKSAGEMQVYDVK
jgi:hypothetical protein